MEIVEVSLYPGEQPGFVSRGLCHSFQELLTVGVGLISAIHSLPVLVCTLYCRSFALLNTLISRINFLSRFSKPGTLVSPHPFKGSHFVF